MRAGNFGTTVNVETVGIYTLQRPGPWLFKHASPACTCKGENIPLKTAKLPVDSPKPRLARCPSAPFEPLSLPRLQGLGKFRGFSAGSQPKGAVHPLALRLLESLNFPTAALRSKSWNEFAQPGAPQMDFVFTVCDNAAAEVCPLWPGQPMTAHWGVADPAAVEGDDVTRIQAFRTALRELESRIKIFTSLPIGSLDSLRLKQELDAIGRPTATESLR